VPTLDINLADTLDTTPRADVVKVPLNFSVVALLNTLGSDGASCSFWVWCPDTSAAAISGFQTRPDGSQDVAQLRVRTSATGTINSKTNVTTANLYNVYTTGFIWARRN